MWLYGWQPLMVSHHSEKFDGHRHCGSVYMIILVVEEEHSRWSCFNHNYCLSLKDMTWKHTAYYINSSNLDHTCLKQQLERSLKMTFASPSRKGDEKKKKRRKTWMTIAKLKVTHKRSNCWSFIPKFTSFILQKITEND